MITLDEAKDLVDRRLVPHAGQYALDAELPRLVFAGTDLPANDLLDLIVSEIVGTATLSQLSGERLESMMTGPMIRMLLVGFEMGRSAEA